VALCANVILAYVHDPAYVLLPPPIGTYKYHPYAPLPPPILFNILVQKDQELEPSLPWTFFLQIAFASYSIA